MWRSGAAHGKVWGRSMNKLDPLIAALLSGGLITGIVALAGHFVTLWNSEQEARRQREIENQREQDAALQEYINTMKAFVNDLLSLRDALQVAYLRERAVGRTEPPELRQLTLPQESRLRVVLTSQQESSVRVGESQTIAILLSVAGPRKRVPITLVHRLGLISRDWPVLDLS